MTTKASPSCSLDGAANPPVIRCNHCRTEQPVAFPMDVRDWKGVADAFLADHALCHHGLRRLYRMRKRAEARAEALAHAEGFSISRAGVLHRANVRSLAIRDAIQLLKAAKKEQP